MSRQLRALIALGCVGVLAGRAAGATVRIDLVPADNPGATQVTAQRAASVPYQLLVQVTSDTATPDNNGLSFFSIDIATTLGIQQPPLDSFTPQIAAAFPSFQSLGTPTGSNLTQIGGGQNTAAGGTGVANIGVNQRQLIGTGHFLAPTQVGSFTVGIASTTTANVFLPGSLTSATKANVQAGPGFTITVVPNLTTTTTGTSTGTTTGTSTGTTTGTATSTISTSTVSGTVSGTTIAVGLAAFIGAALLVVFVAFANPFAAVILMPILLLLLIALLNNLPSG